MQFSVDVVPRGEEGSLFQKNFKWGVSHRLRDKKSIHLVYDHGTKIKMVHGAVFFLPAQELKVAISVSRKAGNAVARNLQKRLTREFFRLHQHKISPCWIIVVIYKPYEDLRFFSKEISKACLKAGIWLCDDSSLD